MNLHTHLCTYISSAKEELNGITPKLWRCATLFVVVFYMKKTIKLWFQGMAILDYIILLSNKLNLLMFSPKYRNFFH